uniref:Uncharacterized protein n=1 Tax=Candidatus Kentrum sp. LFY TaxID=2126342 RepID=A0A450UPN6_9GAMM|nr:MAG: hypothetical protein BECKLFY1418B_GA0070995_10593 [Candidatus Kentron sp. LFY]
MKWFKFYEDLHGSFRIYWRAYGGWSALVRSPYLFLAIVFSCLMFPYWEEAWWQVALNTISNLLGFSIGGYAIWLAIGDQKFTDKLAGPGRDNGKHSPYITVNATFVHFVFVQLLVMLTALLFQAWIPEYNGSVYIQIGTVTWFLSAIGYTLFLYALFMALAAAFTVFRVSQWYDRFIAFEKKTKG